MSFVARAIQSTARDVRLRTNRAPSSRTNAVSVAPDHPSFGNGCSGTPVSPFSARSCRTERIADASAGRGDVVRAVRPAIEVDDVRVGAVAGQDDDQRLRRRRVRLDMDLAGRDVDEVAGLGVERVLDPGRSVGVAPPRPTGCRSTSRSRRDGGSGSGRRAPSTRSTSTAGPTRRSASRWRSTAPCPACWPMVVWRSVGLIRTAMAGMVREPGTIGSCLPGPRILPVSRASRCSTGPRPRAIAAPVGGPRWSGRALDQARGPAPARVRWQQAAQPRIPRRGRPGRGRRLPGHDRPPLVEPRSPDGRRRGAGRPARPPRPVRSTDRPAEPGHRARRAPRRDDPPGGDRRPCRALGPPRAGRRGPARRRSSAVGHRDRRRQRRRGRRPGHGRSRAGRPGRRSRPRVRRRRRPLGHGRDARRAAGRRPDRWVRGGRPGRGGHPGRRRPAGGQATRRRARRHPGARGRGRLRDRHRRDAARRGLRPADRRGRRGDPPPRPDRGDPRRPHLHREGTRRAGRRGPVRPARRAGAPCSGTPAGHPGLFEPLDP